jgi:hypothetical protein
MFGNNHAVNLLWVEQHMTRFNLVGIYKDKPFELGDPGLSVLFYSFIMNP